MRQIADRLMGYLKENGKGKGVEIVTKNFEELAKYYKVPPNNLVEFFEELMKTDN